MECLADESPQHYGTQFEGRTVDLIRGRSDLTPAVGPWVLFFLVCFVFLFVNLLVTSNRDVAVK